jgi:hypothetical protein
VPDIPFKGMVTVKAMLCYATKVDPHHPGNYTRAGLEVYFRPNEEAFKDDKAEHASTKSFFGKGLTVGPYIRPRPHSRFRCYPN